MGSQQVERRLAAILSADVAGYSRLMADDEEATIRAIQLRREQVEIQVRQHAGRLVDFTGDNFLVEFRSAVQALECAVEIQRGVAALNEELPRERRMTFRLGLHLGEVRAEQERLFGTGVNLAARLEALAQPGGICVSAELYREVSGRTRYRFRDLGERRAKNLPDPIHAYALELEDAGESRPPTAWTRWIGGGVFVLVAALALVGWWQATSRTSRAPSEHPTALVVLPFDDLSPQGDQAYFAHGVSEELTSALARTPGLRVLGRTTAEVVKHRRLTVTEIGQELGVQALLEGSVRRAGDRLRITAQLVTVEDGSHLWSETYDRPMTDVFAIQDEVAHEVAEALQVVLVGGRRHPPTQSLRAYENTLRGKLAYERSTEDAMRRAIDELEETLALDPDYTDAMVTLGILYTAMRRQNYEYDERNLERAEALARQALRRDPRNHLAHKTLGQVHEFRYELRAAESEYQLAVQLGASNDQTRALLGVVRVALGDIEGGLAQLDEAVDRDPLRFLTVMVAGWTHGRVGDRERGIRLLRRAWEVEPRAQPGWLLLAHAYWEQGREREALRTLMEAGLPSELERALRSAHEESGMRGAWAVFIDRAKSSSGRECTSNYFMGAVLQLPLGRHEAALRCIQEGVARRALGSESYLLVDPGYDPIRQDPRFQAALSAMGVAD